ncbi:MAG: GNAT family N-acetyltransferase [Tepidisphaeraceae bacterium]|jgi:hypothetical protein
MTPLSTTFHDSLDCLQPAQWRELFADHPDSLEMVRLIQNCGMDGFTFGSIIVRQGDEPILMLPLFETRFRLATLLDGAAATIARSAEKILPNLLSPKLLGAGLVEGEWGQAGIKPGVATSVLSGAWRQAAAALKHRQREARASLTVLLNFTPAAVDALPADFAARFSAIDTIPCARLPIDFATVDEYLQRLSKNMRKDLRRKLKSAEGIEILRPTDAGDWLDRIYALYLDTVRRAPLSLGIQRKEYFRRATQDVPGAHYVLYAQEKNLLAFNLLVERDGTLIDKYFCMDDQAGRARSLYFVSWMENIAYCCRTGLKMYHAGPGAEGTKARLGVTFLPSITLFRHRNPAAHWALSKLKGLMAYHPQTPIPDSPP